MKDIIMFRLVPTMRCNFRCEYCFEPNNPKKYSKTMFDEKSVDEWIEGLKRFDDYNIELYLWGGEPFCIEGTYEFIRKAMKLDNVISGCRIDTNTFYARKIAEKCPTNKIKLNCSYHMQYHTLKDEVEKIKILKNLDMVGMVNFVASPYNLKHLKDDYHMTVADLIKVFAEMGVFVNIAGDFAYANDSSYERLEEYREFILQFISPEEWKWLRGVNEPRECNAGRKMFTVNHNGDFTSCISNRTYGNLFEGVLIPDKEVSVCKKCCPSLVAYPFRLDNDFPNVNSLLAYVDRNEKYRAENVKSYVDFEF